MCAVTCIGCALAHLRGLHAALRCAAAAADAAAPAAKQPAAKRGSSSGSSSSVDPPSKKTKRAAKVKKKKKGEAGPEEYPDPDDEDMSDAERKRRKAAYRHPLTGETTDEIWAGRLANWKRMTPSTETRDALVRIGVTSEMNELKPYAKWTKKERIDVIKFFRGRPMISTAGHLWIWDVVVWLQDDPQVRGSAMHPYAFVVHFESTGAGARR